MWHVLFRTVLQCYSGAGVAAQVIKFDCYEAAEEAIKALEKNKQDTSSLKTEAIRLYQ